MTSAIERNELVEKILQITGGEVFEAIVVPNNGHDGCLKSHTEVYKQVPENESLLVFEDDCVIRDETFLEFINKNKSDYDIIYIGVNSICKFNEKNEPIASWGTHSMWINSKAIKSFLHYMQNLEKANQLKKEEKEKQEEKTKQLEEQQKAKQLEEEIKAKQVQELNQCIAQLQSKNTRRAARKCSRLVAQLSIVKQPEPEPEPEPEPQPQP